MSEGEIFYGLPQSLLGAALLLFLFAGAELGSRIGQRRHAPGDTGDGPEFSTLEGAILGLLALLLAFTYSLASGRYDSRKQAVIEEANAVGTVWLRARLVAQPYRDEIQALLRRYVDVRLEFASAPFGDPSARAAVAESESLHGELWDAVERSAAGRTPTTYDALLVQALNDVIDAHGVRVAALRDHVPEIVLTLLIFVAMVSTGLFGYAAGSRGQHHRVPAAVLSALIVAVIIVTMDLDRPRRGCIRVSQQPIVDLKESFGPG